MSAALRWMLHDWPDGAVIYDRHTGDTHALDALSAEILQLPPSQRQDCAAACDAIAAVLAQTLDDTLRGTVQEAFRKLRKLNLI